MLDFQANKNLYDDDNEMIYVFRASLSVPNDTYSSFLIRATANFSLKNTRAISLCFVALINHTNINISML